MIISVDPAQSEDIAAFALVKQYNLHSFSVNLTAASWVTDSVNGGYKYEVEYGDETYYFVYLEPNAIVSYYNDLEDPTNFTAACDAGITLEQVDAVEESSQSYVLLFHAETLPNRDVTINVLLYGDKIKDSEGQHDIPPTPSELLERIIALEEGKVDKLETTGKFAYMHTDSTQGEVAIVDGTTANTLPIRDNSGRMHSASPSAGSNDTTVATTSWATTKLGNYVDLTSVQSISGAKTFDGVSVTISRAGGSNLILKNPAYSRESLPTANVATGIDFIAHDGSYVAYQQMGIESNGNGFITFVTRNHDKSISAGMTVHSVSGGSYVDAPYRTYNSSNIRDVVTIGSLKVATDVVHTTGAETIAGSKSFTAPMIIDTGSNVNPLTIKGNVPYITYANNTADITQGVYSSYVTPRFSFTEKNGYSFGTLGVYAPNANSSRFVMESVLRDSTGTSKITSGLNVRAEYENNSYVGYGTITYRATPTMNGEILTMGNGMTLTTYQHVTGVKHHDEDIYFSTSARYGSTNQSDTWGKGIRLLDNVNSQFGRFQPMIYANGSSSLTIYTGEKGITLYSAGYVTASTRAYDATHTSDIVTIGSLKASTDVVHTTGTETIAGNKTFTSVMAILGISPALTITKSTLSRTYVGYTQAGGVGIYCNDGMIGNVYSLRSTPLGFAASGTIFEAYNSSGGVQAISLWSRDNGEGYVTVPSAPPTQPATRNITISTSDPSGGNNGDIWIKYTA